MKKYLTSEEKDKKMSRILELGRQRRQEIEDLHQKVLEVDSGCDLFYRFYHQSFKVYPYQKLTEQMADLLRELSEGSGLNEWFEQIIDEGTGIEFTADHNDDWLRHTRPILEAFWHASKFLRLLSTCITSEPPPKSGFLPTDYAALLYLYNLR